MTCTRLSLHVLLLLVSYRHSHAKTAGLLPTPRGSTSPLPTDVRSAIFKGESHTEKVELLNPVSLLLDCVWTSDQKKAANVTGYWVKDGEEIQNSRVMLESDNKQYHLRGVFGIVNEENLGNYSCVFGNTAKIDFILTVPQLGEVRDKPMVSYAGDTAVITCKMEETKPRPNTWNWYKSNGTDKEQIVPAAEPLHYEIKTNEWKTQLLVHNLSKHDSGLYHCAALYDISTTMSHVELKVITIMEPLKPFAVILLEVLVLVAGILLYEKTQSQKDVIADKESDADQKNTEPPAEETGPGSSGSIRQRK